MWQPFFVIVSVVLVYGVFRLNDRRHKWTALENIRALESGLGTVTAKYLKNPNAGSLLRLNQARAAELSASALFRARRFAKAESEAEGGLLSVQLAHEALLFSNPEFRFLATGCRGQ